MESPIDPLLRIVERLENDPLLVEQDRLRERLDALDRLDACFPNAGQTSTAIADELTRRAHILCARFEEVNQAVYEAIRSEIRSGARPGALLRWIDVPAESTPGPAYDFLDELISGVLQLEEPEVGQAKRDSEIVFYQPTPARHIFTLMRETALTGDDVFVDLGSGLGHVPLLVSICTAPRSIGIEVEASYVGRARACARRLHLSGAEFVAEDARDADLSSGTVFYLYTPFSGSMLRCVLDRLRGEGASRTIRVCTYGPCTSVVAEEPWLETGASPVTDRVVLFRSRG
jgi:Histone methylation protein DOT1